MLLLLLRMLLLLHAWPWVRCLLPLLHMLLRMLFLLHHIPIASLLWLVLEQLLLAMERLLSLQLSLAVLSLALLQWMVRARLVLPNAMPLVSSLVHMPLGSSLVHVLVRQVVLVHLYPDPHPAQAHT